MAVNLCNNLHKEMGITNLKLITLIDYVEGINIGASAGLEQDRIYTFTNAHRK